MKHYQLTRYPHCYYYWSDRRKFYGYRFSFTNREHRRTERKQSGFRTAQDCYRAMLGRRATVQPKDADVTLGEYTITFLRVKALHVKKSTYVSYKSLLENYVVPYLGQYPLRKLTTQLYDSRCMSVLVKSGLRHSTLGKITDRLSTMLNYAVKNQVIERNPLFKYQVPKGKPSISKQLMSRGQKQRFDRQLAEEPLSDQTMFTLLEETGMRIGEALGLRWCDISLSGNTVHIRHTRDYYGLRTPKTAHSKRDVSLTPGLQKLFRNYREQTGGSGKQIVFRNRAGNPVSESSVGYRLDQVLADAGMSKMIHRFTLHSFRHEFASMLIASGKLPIQEISRYLGHANVGITMRIYANYIPRKKQNLGNIFDQLSKRNGNER